MSTPAVADALKRAQAVFARRPHAAVHDDAPATARWTGGTACITTHANGTALATDMPPEMGGEGAAVTPGFLFRAGVAACTATRIAMGAALAGIALDRLEVVARSRSDSRGLLGMRDEAGAKIGAGPLSVALDVTLAASGVTAERLRALVEDACAHSPTTCAVRGENEIALAIDVLVS